MITEDDIYKLEQKVFELEQQQQDIVLFIRNLREAMLQSITEITEVLKEEF